MHKLLKIKGGYMVFPWGTLPTPVREAGERFRFGSFNHARKLTDASIDLFYRKVIQACPNTELVLKASASMKRLKRHVFASVLKWPA